MKAADFVEDLSRANQAILSSWDDLGAKAPVDLAPASFANLLKIALTNEISVSDVSAAWMSTVQELDVKVALARQVGDESRHFQLLQDRLRDLGVSLDDYSVPTPNGLFRYLRGLQTTVERIAAGLFTLESVAFHVNDRFLKICEKSGDLKTARIYSKYIQPDENAHFEMGKKLLQKYAVDEAAQWRARAAAEKTLQAAKMVRAAAAQKCGTPHLPGC